VARVKSEAMRRSILAAAAAEFSERGYLKTTVNSIASAAGTAPSNVYVYFTSKVEIALAVYEPWFKRRILALEQAVAKATTPETKTKRLVHGLLQDIALDKSGYTSTLVEALATAMPTDDYRPDLLLWAEHKLTRMIHGAAPKAFEDEDSVLPVARLLMMIFDSVALRKNLKQQNEIIRGMLDFIVDLVTAEAKSPAHFQKRKRQRAVVAP
jgi:AcrR family transcriptional regulator